MRSEATCAWGRSWEGWGLSPPGAWPSFCWQADSKHHKAMPAGGEKGGKRGGNQAAPSQPLPWGAPCSPLLPPPYLPFLQCCAVGRDGPESHFWFCKAQVHTVVLQGVVEWRDRE